MGLKAIAEKLAEDLVKAGKKLDRSVIQLAESVDGIVGSIPKAEFAQKGFAGLPVTAQKAMVDGLLKVTDAATSNKQKTDIANAFTNEFRIKFPAGAAGDTEFQRFKSQFGQAIDAEMKAGAKPEVIRQAGGPVAPRAETPVTQPRRPTPVDVTDVTPRAPRGGPVAQARGETPVSTGAENPTFNIDGRTRPGERNMGNVDEVRRDPTFDESPAAAPARGGDGGNKPPTDDNGMEWDDPNFRSTARATGDAAKQAAAQAKLSSLFIDLTTAMGKEDAKGFLQALRKPAPNTYPNMPQGPVADALTTGNVVKKMIDLFTSEEGQYLQKMPGKLSPKATFDALREGYSVDLASLQGMAEKLSQGKPLSMGERLARYPKTTLATAALALYTAGSTYDFFISDTLGGTPIVQNVPPSFVFEWADKATTGANGQTLPGMDDYKAQVDWEIMKATNDTKYRNLLVAATLTTMDEKQIETTKKSLGAVLDQLPKSIADDPKDGFDPAKLTDYQRQAGMVFIARLTSGIALSVAEQQQTTAQIDTARVTAAAQGALMSPTVPSLDSPPPAAAPPVQPVYSQYALDGEIFNNRLKSITPDEPKLYDELASAFKKATKMQVADSAELTSANKATREEVVSFAEEAKSILSVHKVAPEEQQQMIDILTKPAAGYSPAPAR